MNTLENLTFMAAAEDHLFREWESYAQHVFIGSDVTHKMNRASALQGEAETVGRPLHHIRLRVVVFREAVAVHCG